MATLAAQITTDLAVLVSDKTIKDYSKQRSDPTEEDTAKTAKVCAHVAAMVQVFLGSVDGDDVVAVDLGTRLALGRYANVYSMRLTEEGRALVNDVMVELETVAERRVAGLPPSDPATTAAETTPAAIETALDNRYPATQEP